MYLRGIPRLRVICVSETEKGGKPRHVSRRDTSYLSMGKGNGSVDFREGVATLTGITKQQTS
jgi:hypothetical protein